MRDRALSQSDESSAIVLIVEDDPDIVEILDSTSRGAAAWCSRPEMGSRVLRHSAVSALTLP